MGDENKDKNINSFHGADFINQLISTASEYIGVRYRPGGTSKEGFDWLRNNLLSDDVELFTAKKNYSEDKALDKFKIIQQGAVITKGDLFNYFEKLVSE